MTRTYIIPSGDGDDYETRLTFAGAIPRVSSRQDQLALQFFENCVKCEVRLLPDDEWREAARKAARS